LSTCSRTGPEIEIAPDLVEEALFLWMRAAADRGEDALVARWERGREAAYRERSGSARASAFRALARSWSRELELEAPLGSALERCPHASERIERVLVRKVARARDEGSELYVDESGTDAVARARLTLTLRARTFLDPRELFETALREFLHAEDMLDPDFGYRPSLPAELAEEPARHELVRDRLRVLWEARVAGRMAALGGGSGPLPDPTPAFRRAFSAVPPESCRAIWNDAQRQRPRSWDGMMAVARSPGEARAGRDGPSGAAAPP